MSNTCSNIGRRTPRVDSSEEHVRVQRDVEEAPAQSRQVMWEVAGGEAFPSTTRGVRGCTRLAAARSTWSCMTTDAAGARSAASTWRTGARITMPDGSCQGAAADDTSSPTSMFMSAVKVVRIQGGGCLSWANCRRRRRSCRSDGMVRAAAEVRGAGGGLQLVAQHVQPPLLDGEEAAAIPCGLPLLRKTAPRGG